MKFGVSLLFASKAIATAVWVKLSLSVLYFVFSPALIPNEINFKELSKSFSKNCFSLLSILVNTDYLFSIVIFLIKKVVLKKANIYKLGYIGLLFKNVASNNKNSFVLLKSNGLYDFKHISMEIISQ